MAKTTGPLLSLDAHGSLSKLLTYSNKRTGQQVRKYNKPLAIPSALQRAQRRLTEFLVAHWQNMTTAQRATWEANAKASGRNLPGYHYFLREAQRDLYTHHGLAMYLHCNTIVGGKVLDLSGKANHGTLYPSYPSNAPTLINSVDPIFSKGLNYDGVDEYVHCGDAASLNPGNNFSMEFVVRPNVISGDRRIASKSGDWYGSWFLNFAGGGQINWKVAAGGPDWEGPDLSIPIVSGRVYHVIVTYDKSYARVFANGLYAETVVTLNMKQAGDIVLISRDGYDPDPKWFSGLTDEVCFYNRAFSIAEAQTRLKFARRY